MCVGCSHKTSVTAGTIFHRTRTPLSTWFAAIWFVTSQKNGISALGLQRVLGFASYETAWAWLHKLRRAMVRPDRDLLSRHCRGRRDLCWRCHPNGMFDATAACNVPVDVVRNTRTLDAVRSGGRRPWKPGFVSSPLRASSRALRSAPTAPDFTFRLRHGIYPHLAAGYVAETKPACCPASTWSPHCSNAGSSAPCTTASSDKHLPYYLDEYTFRFNRRTSKSRGLLFYRLLQQAVHTDHTH